MWNFNVKQEKKRCKQMEILTKIKLSAIIFIKDYGGGIYYDTYQNNWNSQSLWKRKKWRLRRMPDILPVCLQNKLRYC